MTLRPSDIRDPQALMRELSTRASLTDGSAFLLLVAEPSTTQSLVSAERLRTPAVLGHWSQARDELSQRIESLAIPRGPERPWHLLMTVVVRAGLCVFGHNEDQWILAWRYSHHFAHAYDGGVVLVTEHGWRAFISDDGGHSPALVALTQTAG
jgi:hypothetical protein